MTSNKFKRTKHQPTRHGEMTMNERQPQPQPQPPAKPSRRSPVPVIIVDKSLSSSAGPPPPSVVAISDHPNGLPTHHVPSSTNSSTKRGNLNKTNNTTASTNGPFQKQKDKDRVAGRRLAFSQRAQSHIRLDDDTTSTTSTAPTLVSSTSSGFWSLSESSITFDPSSLRSGALTPTQRSISGQKAGQGVGTPERRTSRSKSAPRPSPNADNFQRVAQERRVRVAAGVEHRQKAHLRRADGRPLANRINAAKSRPRPTTMQTSAVTCMKAQPQVRRRPSDVARIGQVPVPSVSSDHHQKQRQQQQQQPQQQRPIRRVDHSHSSRAQQSNRPRARASPPPQVTTHQAHSLPQTQLPAQERTKGRASSTEDVLSFKDFYRISQEIDRGSFSRVYECYHRYTAVKFAVKVIDRRSLSLKADDAVFREARILQELQNKRRDTTADGEEGAGFVRLVDFFIEPTRFFLVMDYMAGATLFDRVLDKHYYPEDDARILIARLLKAVSFMHRHDVIHRDLKPQNLLLADKGDDTNAFIGDFGFATVIRPVLDEKTNRMTRRVLRQKCGTPSYVAPEILAGRPYDQAADMWSLGVITFFCLGGYPPFVSFDSRQEMFQKIMRGEFEFHETDWSGVSNQAKDFIRALLTVDPNKRMTASQALFHPWILSGDISKPQKILPPAKDASTTSKKGKGVRKAIKAAFASKQLSSSSKHLQSSGENVNRIRTASQ